MDFEYYKYQRFGTIFGFSDDKSDIDLWKEFSTLKKWFKMIFLKLHSIIIIYSTYNHYDTPILHFL